MTEYVPEICNVILTAICTTGWFLVGRASARSGRVHVRRNRVNPVREALRLKLFAGRQGEGRAYHVTSSGLVLTARAKDFYAALFAGVDDFWQLVEVYGGRRHTLAADRVKAEFADRERDFTRIECCCGETYVDAVFPPDLPHPYLATRVAGKEIARKVEDAQRAADKRGGGDDGFKGGMDVHGASMADSRF